jgi:hypothetical protein
VLPDNLRIIERDQWERVQRQLDRNIVFSLRNTKHEYLLRGLIKCGGCGARYVGDPNHGTFYYRCVARCKKLPAIRETLLDDRIWEAVEEAILNPHIIIDQLAALYGHRKTDDAKQDTEQQEIEVMFIGIDKEEERILEAYRMNILSPAQLSREMEKLSTRRASLEGRKAKLSRNANTVEFPVIERSLTDYCQIAAQRLNTFSYEERRQFLRLLIDEIVYVGSQVRIRGVIPTSQMNSLERSGAASYSGENSISSRVEIAEKGQGYEGFNSYRIANMTVCHHDPNEVEHIPFELLKDMPDTTPVCEILRPEMLRRLAKANPRATLNELAYAVQNELGIKLSITHMSRLLRSVGLNSKARRQLTDTSNDPSLDLAA